MTLRVLVAPPNTPSWEADTGLYVFPEALKALQVGSPVMAWYMPTDPLTVALTNDED